MANTLTDLAADIYKAADIVGREQVGLIPSVMINAGAERAAFGDTVRSHVTSKPTLNTTYSPSMTIPEGDDQTVGNKTMTIDKVANVQIPWTGEDIRHVNNGSGFETIYGDQIAQSMRTITNQIESDLWGEIYKNASRATGTAGTTPFGSNFDTVAEIRQILADNGTPMDGQVTLGLASTAGTKLRNLAQLQKANESGGTQLLRQGTLLNLQGVMIKESAGVGSHTAGSVTGDPTVTGANAVGATTIGLTCDADDEIAILEGDVVSFASDDNLYVAAADLTVGNSSTGNLEIAEPGLRQATSGSEAVSVESTFTGNVGFHRNAVELVARPPSQPFGGDAAVDRMTVQDPFSGLVYEIAVYKGYGKQMFDITTFYAAKSWKDEFIATLMG
jgi:hypothetical protein